MTANDVIASARKALLCTALCLAGWVASCIASPSARAIEAEALDFSLLSYNVASLPMWSYADPLPRLAAIAPLLDRYDVVILQEVFANWERLVPDERGFAHVGEQPAELQRAGFQAFLASLGVLVTCLKEAPELEAGAQKK